MIGKKYILLLITLLPVGCDKHRDLYVIQRPMLDLVADWNKYAKIDPENPPGEERGSQGATTMFFDARTGKRVSYVILNESTHYRLNSESLDLYAGNYVSTTFNGTPEDGIAYVRFLGNSLADFRAEATLHPTLNVNRSTSTPPVINNPDTLATHSIPFDIVGDTAFVVRYINGVRQNGHQASHLDTLLYTPRRVSYRVRLKVIVEEGMRFALHEIDGVRDTEKKYRVIATGNIIGFSRGCVLYGRMPLHEEVTQYYSLNGLNLHDGPDGLDSTTTAVFSSFGPPLDLPQQKYIVNLAFTLNVVNGGGKFKVESFNDLDVTEDVNKKIIEILEHRRREEEGDADVPLDLEIPLILRIRITGQGSDDGNIDLSPWDEIEIDFPPREP